MHDGISHRSDVFVGEQYLKQLEHDFCADLLTDTTDALAWLESLNNELDNSEKCRLNSFTYDFKGLYDSLNQTLVIDALKEAMTECRPEWSPQFCNWLVKLVQVSMEASVGIYEDVWYRQKTGVPTGGSLCVQLANIAVYSVMRKAVYNNAELMKNVVAAKRYIDDGAGFFAGTQSQFNLWIIQVNLALEKFGLSIDESSILPPDSYKPFLDIQFCFSKSGLLQTDLYTKPTDSKSYLNFQSCHPPHVFSGLVFSQFLRLRRIINDNSRLKIRIDELIVHFREAGYPQSMLKNMSDQVLKMERSLERNSNHNPNPSTSGNKRVKIVSTYGCDQEIVKSVKHFEPKLVKTLSFNLESPDVNTNHTTEKPSTMDNTSSSRSDLNLPKSNNPTKKPSIFQFVKKVAPTTRSKTNKIKHLALGKRFGHTKRCNSHNCGCCDMISPKDHFRYNNKTFKSTESSCGSYNIIYLVYCSICNKLYIGRSTRPLRTRIGEHRRNFYHILDNKPFSTDNDDFILGSHLYDHGFRDKSDFNKNL